MMKKIGIVGAGYVGISTAVLFAELGHRVTLVDIDKEKVEKINAGKAPIYEKGLQELLEKHVGKTLSATTSYDIINESDIIFICVGTPSKEDGSINLDYVRKSSEEISERIGGYKVIVVKSTVLPGTTENVVIPILEKGSGKNVGKDFGVCMNPEFLREGNAIYDSFHPDRIVIGEYDKKSGNILEDLYKPLNAPIFRTNLKTAEMIKYASNAFLATKISFANEIANICEKIGGVDVYDVMKGVGMDHRISPYFLNAGVGFGGSCFPKDLKALIKFSEEKSYKPILLKSVLEVNDYQPKHLVDRIEEKVGSLKGKNVCILGLSFKPNTDDVRESRAIIIVNELIKRGAHIIAYDPKAKENFRKLFPNIIYVDNVDDALKKAEICIIQADWDEFKNLDYSRYKNLVLIADGRRTISKKIDIPYITVGYRW